MYRYIYINIYAFLLLILGGGIIFILIWFDLNWWIVTLLGIAAAMCLYGGINILLSWESKMREYHILMERNGTKFNAEAFRPFMQAPCGRQLTKVVLKDLGKQERYGELLKMRTTLREHISHGCSHESRITIYTNDNTPTKEQ